MNRRRPIPDGIEREGEPKTGRYHQHSTSTPSRAGPNRAGEGGDGRERARVEETGLDERSRKRKRRRPYGGGKKRVKVLELEKLAEQRGPCPSAWADRTQSNMS